MNLMKMEAEGADTPPLEVVNRRLLSFKRNRRISDSESSASDVPNSPNRSETRHSAQVPDQASAAERPRSRPLADDPAEMSILKVTDDLVLRLSNEFTPLLQTGWDTLVYIGPPARFRNQSPVEYDHIKKHFDQPLRLRSSNLKVLGSSKLDRLLRPNACIRAEKKLKKLGVNQKINLLERDEIKYHIDLRPPNEDEEAVILLTDLTCPVGVLNWHRAKYKYELPSTCVLGTDEFDTPSNPYYVSPLKITQQGLIVTTKGSQQSAETKLEKPDQKNKPAQQVEDVLPPAPEYLPMRHHSAVERLLQAIAGNDPKLDSAPKVWTYFAVAKYFECANHNTINKWIYNWLYGSGNVNFIQNNPEVAYRIGMGIEAADLVQDAFSILVGEKALARVCAEWYNNTQQSTYSTHERVFEFLDDDDQNRVDHAASSLVHRIRKVYGSLSLEMQWMELSEEYSKLKKLELQDADELQTLQSFKSILQEFIRGKMYAILCKENGKAFTDLDQFAVDVKALRQGKFPRFTAIYNQLNQPMRLFTRTYWMALQRVQFQFGDNISCGEIEELNGGQRLLQAMREAWQTDPENGIKVVTRDVLSFAASEVSALFKKQAKQHRDNVSEKGYVNPQSLSMPMQSPKRSSGIREYETRSPGKRRKTNETKELPLRPIASRPLPPNTTSYVDTMRSSTWQSVPQDVDTSSSFVKNFGAKFSEDLGAEHIPSLDKDSEWIVDAESLKPEASTTNVSPNFIFPMDPSSPPTNYAKPKQGSKVVVGAEDGNVVAVVSPLWEPRSGGLPEETTVLPIRKSVERDTSNGFGEEDKLPPHSTYFAPAKYGYVESFDIESGLPVYQLPQTQHLSGADNSEDSPNILLDLQDSVPANSQPDDQPEEHLLVETDPWEINWPAGPTRFPYQTAAETIALSKKSVKLTDRDIDFNVDKVLRELSQILSKKCEEIVYPPHLFHGNIRVPIDLVDTLTCLEDDEWKYLPLWAGGCDDGTGGVFEEIDVPNLESGGFRGGKRGYRSRSFDKDATDSSISGTETDSSFDDIASEAISTVGKASKLATDGTETVKSLGSTTESESGFMNQDEIYESIREMKIEEARKGKAKAENGLGYGTFEDLGMRDRDADDDGDRSTVMGAGSDVQGHMFHDIDDDEDDNEKEKHEDVFDDHDDEDDDMEIIDKNDL